MLRVHREHQGTRLFVYRLGGVVAGVVFNSYIVHTHSLPPTKYTFKAIGLCGSEGVPVYSPQNRLNHTPAVGRTVHTHQRTGMYGPPSLKRIQTGAFRAGMFQRN
jgi:hypothetical protein